MQPGGFGNRSNVRTPFVGVDHPGIWRMLVERGYQGWITLDLDPPRPSEGEGSVEDKVRINVDYLKNTLEVGTL